MKRPQLVWLVFAACVAVGFGVLGWFTREMLRLERESVEARRLAATEENVRLALWRMDSALASVHGLEAARPWQEFEAFHSVVPAFSGDFSRLADGTVMRPSPLLTFTPPFVKLHFQIDATGAVSSPQAPAPAFQNAALIAGQMPAQLQQARLNLEQWRNHLDGVDLASLLPPLPPATDLSATDLVQTKEESTATPVQSLVEKLTRRRTEQEADTFISTAPAEALLSAEAKFDDGPRRAPEIVLQQQNYKSTTEQMERSNLVYASNELNAAQNRSLISQNFQPQTTFGGAFTPAPQLAQTAQESALPASDAQAAAAKAATVAESQASTRTAGPSESAESERLADEARREAESAVRARVARDPSRTSTDRIGSVAVADAAAAAPPMSAPPTAVAPGAAVARRDSAGAGTASTAPIMGPLHSLWVGSELVFARRVAIEGRTYVQGAWLDWAELQAWLLSRVSDLLPNAKLEPAPPGSTVTAFDAARRLAFLPVKLEPGAIAVDDSSWSSSFSSPLRTSLTAAWVSAVIGAIALALLLRGTLRLSERRGAFVSAVTHELRTPLTTFRLYTEMLAGGMVADETKRHSYLDTLRTEAERLSHLVENVLSYARLERGRAASRVEGTTPAALLGRIEERLRQRAQQGSLEIRIEFASGIEELALRTDTTAVEQVLFNLVDNATKYGRPPANAEPGHGRDGVIHLTVARLTPSRLAIRVIDHGPGLTPTARRRLFQPFSKSASEAAHSQPGVGLGLALSRRLARDELHGDLVLERTGPEGTTFRLELPVG